MALQSHPAIHKHAARPELRPLIEDLARELGLPVSAIVERVGSRASAAESAAVDPILSHRRTASIVGASEATLKRWVRSGQFPRPLKLGRGRTGRIGFPASEVAQWLLSRPRA